MLEALRRRDRATRRPRAWLDLATDAGWLEVEVGTRHLRTLVSRMAKKGSLFPLGGGRYVVAAPGVVDSAQALPLFAALDIKMMKRPYYLAFAAALADHRLIDEMVDPIIAVPARVMAGNDPLEVQGREVHTVRISSQRKWIGREHVEVESHIGYWRSDLERTLLDVVDRPEISGGSELVARSWERAVREDRLDRRRLREYALALGGMTARRAAFYLQELSERDLAHEILAVVGRTRSSNGRLDPSGAFRDGPWQRDRLTGLQINVPPQRLHGWLTYGK